MPTLTLKRFIAVSLAYSFLPLVAAQATDGVIELNETCAVQTGCFLADAPGYPITIVGQIAGGTYRLTSNLVVPNENTDGIQVSVSSVTIDLNGFEIVRNGCQGATSLCTPLSGIGSGIIRSTSSHRGTAVKNGTITGMGQYGVRLAEQAEVTNLRVRWNRYSGIQVGDGSTVSGNTAYENGLDGIGGSSGSTVSGNSVYRNGDEGIEVNPGSTVRGNTAHGNAGDGIRTSIGSTVSGNTTYQNGVNGIVVGAGSLVQGNAAYGNLGSGIVTGSGATVQNNTARGNSIYGISLGSQSAYRENVITNNGTGTVLGGVNMFSNSCNGTTTCP